MFTKIKNAIVGFFTNKWFMFGILIFAVVCMVIVAALGYDIHKTLEDAGKGPEARALIAFCVILFIVIIAVLFLVKNLAGKITVQSVASVVAKDVQSVVTPNAAAPSGVLSQSIVNGVQQ